jgi:CRISPR type III-A/MTUBE-associated protein Csm6
MRKKVLFSPVGNSDPIRDCYDGAMIHICRYYKPDTVYLYLSKEMLEYHKKDNRYLKTLELLGGKIGHRFEVEVIERPELTDPHIFDAFYSDFEGVLNNIAKPNDSVILLNISSGTPAMKGALQTIAAMSYNLYIPIQVSTPAKGSNKSNGNHLDYDIELHWENDIDNTPEGECRCTESAFENLNAKLKKEIIFAHIDSYDYPAALSVAKSMGGFATRKSLEMLEIARSRFAMEFPQVGYRLRDLGLQYFYQKPEYEKLLESILWLQIKEKRGEYVDLIRGITPVVTELFIVCLKNKCKIEIEKYCEAKAYNREKNYLRRKTLEDKAPHILKILDDYYATKGFSDSYLSSANMSIIIKGLNAENTYLSGLVDKLNQIDGERIRHIAAHTLTSITDDYVQKQTGYYCREIINLIKKMLPESGVFVNEESWLAYEKMNDAIKESFK